MNATNLAWQSVLLLSSAKFCQSFVYKCKRVLVNNYNKTNTALLLCWILCRFIVTFRIVTPLGLQPRGILHSMGSNIP